MREAEKLRNLFKQQEHDHINTFVHEEKLLELKRHEMRKESDAFLLQIC